MGLRDIFAALAVVTIWAANFSAVKIGITEIPPLLLLSLRFAILALIMFPFLGRYRGSHMDLVWVALCLGVLHFGTLYVALRGLESGTASILIMLSIPFSALAAYVVFSERLSLFQGIGLVASFAGVYVLWGSPRLGGAGWAVALVVFSAFAWSVANILIKRLGAVDGFALNAWVALFTAPFALVASFIFESGQGAAVLNAGLRGWGSAIFTAVFSSFVAYGLWYHLIYRHPVNSVVPFTLLVPAIAMLIALPVLGEDITWYKLAGGALTVTGVGLIQLTAKKPTP